MLFNAIFIFVLDRLCILIGKYEMRHKNQSFLRKYLSIFKEEMCENVKMEITKRPIKIFIIILKRVIRIQQIINIKIALNSTVFTY